MKSEWVLNGVWSCTGYTEDDDYGIQASFSEYGEKYGVSVMVSIPDTVVHKPFQKGVDYLMKMVVVPSEIKRKVGGGSFLKYTVKQFDSVREVTVHVVGVDGQEVREDDIVTAPTPQVRTKSKKGGK